MKNLKHEFNTIEIDLINEYAKLNKAEIEINESGFITVDSEYLKTSFKVARKNNNKIIKVCINYEITEVSSPSLLKKILGL